MSELVFRGRENEIEELLKFVDEEAGGTFVVNGRPGIGKSRLLQELAKRLEPLDHWVHFFEIPEETELTYLFPLWAEDIRSGRRFFFTGKAQKWQAFIKATPTIGGYLDALTQGPPQPPHFIFSEVLNRVAKALKKKRRCVLLLDPDKLISYDKDANFLKYVFKNLKPGMKVILAQRISDRLSHDSAFLALPNVRTFSDNLEKLSDDQVHDIIVTTAAEQKLALSADTIERMVERIDGWPFAAELYLRWAAMCLEKGKPELLEQIPPDLQLVMQDLYEDCHGPCRAIVDWLGASRTPLSLADLIALMGKDNGQEIDEAFSQSVVRRLIKNVQGPSPRYELFHDGVKAYVEQRLLDRNDLKRMLGGLGKFQLTQWREGNEEAKALSLAHTAGYLLEAGDKRAFIDAVGAQFETKYNRSMFFLCREEMEQALAWAKELELEKKTISFFLGNLGLVYRNLGELDKAAQYHEQALVIHRELGVRQGEAQNLGNLGLVYAQQGDKEKALAHAREGLAIAEQIGAPPLIEEIKGIIEWIEKR